MMQSFLEARRGPDAGIRRPVESTMLIGRSTEADLVLTDPAVSRHHASVRAEGLTVVVEDLGSSNGTWVNGGLIDSPRRLEPGDVIQLGDTVLEVQLETAQTEIATPADPTVVHPGPANR